MNAIAPPCPDPVTEQLRRLPCLRLLPRGDAVVETEGVERRLPAEIEPDDGPVLVCSESGVAPEEAMAATDVKGLLLALISR